MATIRVRNLTRSTLQLPLPHDPVCTTRGRCECLPNGIPSTLIVLPLSSVPADNAALVAPAVARAISKRLISVHGIGVATAAQPKVEPQTNTPEPQGDERPKGKRKPRPAQVG